MPYFLTYASPHRLVAGRVGRCVSRFAGSQSTEKNYYVIDDLVMDALQAYKEEVNLYNRASAKGTVDLAQPLHATCCGAVQTNASGEAWNS